MNYLLVRYQNQGLNSGPLDRILRMRVKEWRVCPCRFLKKFGKDKVMDIKTFVKEVDGLEQWNPLMKGEFPITTSVLRDEVFPAFMVSIPDIKNEVITYEEFIDMINAHPDLQAVKVHKQRFGYMVHDTIWCSIGNHQF